MRVGVWNACKRSSTRSKFNFDRMRFIHIYLIGYFVLLFGAGLALWQAGAFARIDHLWLSLAIIVTFGFGIVLALTSMRSKLIRRE